MTLRAGRPARCWSASYGLTWRARIGLRQLTRRGGGCVLAHLAAGADIAPVSRERLAQDGQDHLLQRALLGPGPLDQYRVQIGGGPQAGGRPLAGLART